MQKTLTFTVLLTSFSVLSNDNDQLSSPSIPTQSTNQAVEKATVSYSGKYISSELDFGYLQIDGTFALSDNFGMTLGTNNVYVATNDHNTNVQNLRLGGFYRNSEYGRVELAYQQLFTDEENDGFYSITGEYYFDNWTLGAYGLSTFNGDQIDISLYTNIYFTDNIRLEFDVFDSSDTSLLSATMTFQLPEYVSNEWQFNVSYGEGFRDNGSQWGLGVKYTPNFNDTLKRFYRNYSINMKSYFFL